MNGDLSVSPEAANPEPLAVLAARVGALPVSYTHLTLPTIYSV